MRSSFVAETFGDEHEVAGFHRGIEAPGSADADESPDAEIRLEFHLGDRCGRANTKTVDRDSVVGPVHDEERSRAGPEHVVRCVAVGLHGEEAFEMRVGEQHRIRNGARLPA